MEIKLLIEHELSLNHHQKIVKLRNACFPQHSSEKSYFKQLPHFRILGFEQDELIAHVGIDHRVVSVGGLPLSIFGIIDLCVKKGARQQGTGALLLDTAKKKAKSSSIDFLVLLADDCRLYKKQGFIVEPLLCQWLRIDNYTNYGVAVENIFDELMVLQVGKMAWPKGHLDFLGYMF